MTVQSSLFDNRSGRGFIKVSITTEAPSRGASGIVWYRHAAAPPYATFRHLPVWHPPQNTPKTRFRGQICHRATHTVGEGLKRKISTSTTHPLGFGRDRAWSLRHSDVTKCRFSGWWPPASGMRYICEFCSKLL